jgi:peptidoglycan/xylan/chitin deacetylase (PgdA/CDA1 family)
LSEPCSYPKTVTPAEAEVFFRQPANFVGKNIEDIFQILGYPDDWADWDLGRVVCAWRNATQIVRVYTGSNGHINYIEVRKLRFLFFLGRSTKVIWRDPKA